MATADAQWRHTFQFTAPLELVTDFGSQFVNDFLTHFHQETGINATLRYRTLKKKMVSPKGQTKRSPKIYKIFYSTWAP